jgi:hypothetical protein
VNEQLLVLPAPSVAVQVTVVVPFGKVDPAAGTHADVTPGQLSPAVGGAYETTAEHCPGSLLTVTFAGQVIDGACVSLTVTVNEQEGPVSEVQVTVVVPTGKNEPVGGEQVTVKQEPIVDGAS